MVLKYLFGSDTLVKVLDFFLENRFWDYTKTDVSKNAEVSRVQLYRIWDILEKLEVVKPSRKIGATVLYKANTESPVFKKMSELSLEIASIAHAQVIREEVKEPIKVEALNIIQQSSEEHQ